MSDTTTNGYAASVGLQNNYWPVLQLDQNHIIHMRLPSSQQAKNDPNIDFYGVVSQTHYPKGDLSFLEFKAAVSDDGEIHTFPHQTFRKKDTDEGTIKVVSPSIDRLMREDGVKITPKKRLKASDHMQGMIEHAAGSMLAAFYEMTDKEHPKHPEFNTNSYTPRSFEKNTLEQTPRIATVESLRRFTPPDTTQPTVAGKRATDIIVDTSAEELAINGNKTAVPDRLYMDDPEHKNKTIEVPHLKIDIDPRLVNKSDLSKTQKRELTTILSKKFEAWILPKDVEPQAPHFFIIKRNKQGSIKSVVRFLINRDADNNCTASPFFYMTSGGNNVVSHPSHNMIINGDDQVLENAGHIANLVAKDAMAHWRNYYDARELAEIEPTNVNPRNVPSPKLTTLQYIEPPRAFGYAPTTAVRGTSSQGPLQQPEPVKSRSA